METFVNEGIFELNEFKTKEVEFYIDKIDFEKYTTKTAKDKDCDKGEECCQN